jgi:PLP dependent protein
MLFSNPIASNIRSIKERIARAAAASGRSPDKITLLAISKMFPKEIILQATAAGMRQFGESRVQEAEEKIPYFCEFPDITWHLVGHLQTNKVRRAAEYFDVIHSLDSVRLAARLDKACLEFEKVMSVFIELDLGKETTKTGADPAQVGEIVEAVSQFRNLKLNGLMTVPPYFENPDLARPYFAELREIREKLEAEQPGCLGQAHLSMGMSHDFEAAIMEGATIIRIGTAIFGLRNYESE